MVAYPIPDDPTSATFFGAYLMGASNHISIPKSAHHYVSFVGVSIAARASRAYSTRSVICG